MSGDFNSDENKLRLVELLLTTWRTYPELGFGRLLTLLWSDRAEVVIRVKRELYNYPFPHYLPDVGQIQTPVDLAKIEDNEWVDRLTKLLELEP